VRKKMPFIEKQTFSFTKKNAEKGRRIQRNPDISEKNLAIPGFSRKISFRTKKPEVQKCRKREIRKNFSWR